MNQKKSPHFTFKEVVDSITNIPSIAPDELASDPEKAKLYLEARGSAIVSAFKKGMNTWTVYDDHDIVKVYQMGELTRFKPNHEQAATYWGYTVRIRRASDDQNELIYFKTEDCFIAWAIASFW